MVKKSHEERLSALLKKQESDKNRIASLKAKIRNEEDRHLTRKKILLGAYMLEHLKDSKQEMESLIQKMDEFLTRPNDRRLFGLK